MEEKKTITLKLTNYKIDGEVKVVDWYDREGILYMTPYYVDNLDLEEIKASINDGGFGVQRIVSAVIDIYENYEGHLKFFESMEIEV